MSRLCRSVLGVYRQLPSVARQTGHTSVSYVSAHVQACASPAAGQDLIERIEAFLGADCGEEGSLLACPWLRRKVRLQAWHVHGCFRVCATGPEVFPVTPAVAFRRRPG